MIIYVPGKYEGQVLSSQGRHRALARSPRSGWPHWRADCRRGVNAERGQKAWPDWPITATALRISIYYGLYANFRMKRVARKSRAEPRIYCSSTCGPLFGSAKPTRNFGGDFRDHHMAYFVLTLGLRVSLFSACRRGVSYASNAHRDTP